jgi:2-desacetyl-2-hydroxyethyl bacteriochlorophyllide A dehydrogenase
MKAVVLEGPHRFRCVDQGEPLPGAGEALVRIVAAGICASDIATIRGENPIAVYPLTLGHESIGVVEEAPAGAAVGAGDWVTIYPSIGCGGCPACAAGRINQCASFKVLGISRDGGFFRKRVSVAARQLIPVPAPLRGERGALVEPAAVAVHVNRRGATRRGERVLVIGAGVVGTLVAQAARAWGAADIVLADRLASRKEVLDRQGFANFVLADGGPLADQLLEQGGPVDVVYDTVCGRATLAAGAKVLRPGGRLVLVAVPHGSAPLEMPFADVYRRELSLIASRNYVPDDFVEAIRLLEAGAVDPDVMITGRVPLSDFATAYAELTGHPERHLKVLLIP